MRTAITSSWNQQIGDNNKIWCSYHKGRSHSDDLYYHEKNDSRSSPDDSKSTKDETFVAESNMTGCDSTFYCKCKRRNILIEVTTSRIPHKLA